MRKNKKLISIFLTLVLSFSLFGVNTFAAKTDGDDVVLQSVEPIIIEKSYIQQMLDKLESILNLLNKKGSITVKCIDEEENVISSQTYDKLKYGKYDYTAPKIDGYKLVDGEQDSKSATINSRNKKPVIT